MLTQPFTNYVFVDRLLNLYAPQLFLNFKIRTTASTSINLKAMGHSINMNYYCFCSALERYGGRSVIIWRLRPPLLLSVIILQGLMWYTGRYFSFLIHKVGLTLLALPTLVDYVVHQMKWEIPWKINTYYGDRRSCPCCASNSSDSSGSCRVSLSILLPLRLMQSLHVTVIEELDFAGVGGTSSYCTALTEPRADEGVAFFFFLSFSSSIYGFFPIWK